MLPDPGTETNATADQVISRRGLLLAGAALVLAGCTPRSKDPLASVPMRPSDQPDRGPVGRVNTSPNQPNAPIKSPTTVAGNGYTLVKRSAWTSQGIKGNNNPMGTVTRITIHHTGEHGNWADISDTEIVKRIDRYHTNEKKWAAIGYHYLVGKDGRIYEGRPVAYQGAHVSTQNENNLGISVIGDFTDRLPTDRQLSALRSFLDDQRRLYGVGKGRVYGHRDLHPSLCPGEALYGWVRRYKTSLA
jgi:hypothetical protein